MVTRRGFMGATAMLAAGPSTAMAQESVGLGGATPTALSAGEHRVDANLIVKGDLLLMPGATIRIAAGRTLTLLGDLRAPAARIFTGPGTIDLTHSRLATSRPEWWGAIPDDPRVDCAAAIEAALTAHHDVQLGAGRYHLTRTLRMAQSNRRLRGVGRSRPEADRTTRLVLTGSDRDIIFVGSDRRAGRIVDFTQGVEISGLHLVRTQSAINAGRGDSSAAPAGLRVRYVLNGLFQDLVAEDHPIGFSFAGTVRTFVRDCQAFMRNDRGGAATAQFWGFHFDGDTDIGLAGGNASLYVADCNASTTYGEPSPRSIGAYLSGAFADIYLVGFECSELGRGIMARGVLGSSSRAVQRAGNADLHIVMPILDQCRQIALDFRDVADHALIDVVNPYAALSGSGAAAVNLERTRGQVSIVGGQMIGWTNLQADGKGIGLCAVESEGFSTTGLKLMGFARPVLLARCSDFDMAVAVTNPDGGAEAAVLLETCRAGTLRARVRGRAASFGAGVRLVDGEALTIETAGIDTRALAGGAEMRVTLNGRPLKGAGTPSVVLVGPSG